MRLIFSLFFMMTLNYLSVSYGKTYKEIEPCGSAGVSEGSTCDKAKVSFKFEGCKSNLPAHAAKSVACNGENIIAKYSGGDYRYEAQFLKVNDGWGAISWKLDGAVKQFLAEVPPPPPVAVAPAPVVAVPAPVIAAPAPVAVAPAPVVAAPTPEASPFKFASFFDVRYTNFTVNHDPNISSGNPESGFGLEDAALYANYEKGNVSVVADVAIRRSKDYDLNSGATKPNQSSNNNLAIGVDKSQLYLRYKVSPSLVFDFGQFDTIYGVELNDSKDRVFGKAGLVYDNTLPVTHAGFMFEYTFAGNYYLKSFIANPNNKGTFGSSTSGDDTAEAGAGLGFANDNFHAQVGYMARRINKASGVGKSNRTLVDTFIGGIIGKFSLDFEMALLTDPSKNTLTASDASDKEKAGEAYLSLLTYKFTPDFQVGIRFEYLRNDPTALSIKSQTSDGVSLHYKLTSEVELRTEYTAYKNKGLTGTEWDDSRFNFATVVVF
jgi:hypothetical protein